jgi:hypothetical protein
MTEQPDLIARTPNPDCPACQVRRRHRLEEWQHHPKAGTGFNGAYGKPPQSGAIAPAAEAQSQK